MRVTHPVQADLRVPVAGREVGFGLWGGALGRGAVTHALMSTLRLLATLLVPALVGALGPAAGALTRTAHTQHINTFWHHAHAYSELPRLLTQYSWPYALLLYNKNKNLLKFIIACLLKWMTINATSLFSICFNKCKLQLHQTLLHAENISSHHWILSFNQ